MTHRIARSSSRTDKRRLLIAGTILTLLVSAAANASAASRSGGTAGGWGGASAISPLCQPDPTRGAQLNDVAINANGTAIAAWDQYQYSATGPYTIGVAVRTSGRWGTPFTVSPTTGFSMSPRVAIGADGTMAVSWTSESTDLTTERVQVAVRAAGSNNWTTTTLAQWTPGGVAITDLVPLGIDASGNVTALWSAWNGARHVVQAASWQAAAGWSIPVTVSTATADAMSPSLAVNARGDASAAYSLSAYSAYGSGTNVQVSQRSGATGSWSLPVTVSETMPSSYGYISGGQVTVDAAGLATVAYVGYGIESTRQLASGSWTLPRAVMQWPNPVSSLLGFDLATDQYGRSVLALDFFDATIGVDRGTVWAATSSADGSWTTPTRLTDPTVPVDAYAPRAAVSPDGSLALVGWIDHYHGVTQVSRLVAGAWSPPNTLGRGTAFSSFQEVMGLDAGSGASAVAVWKSAKGGTQTMAATYGK